MSPVFGARRRVRMYGLSDWLTRVDLSGGRMLFTSWMGAMCTCIVNLRQHRCFFAWSPNPNVAISIYVKRERGLDPGQELKEF